MSAPSPVPDSTAGHLLPTRFSEPLPTLGTTVPVRRSRRAMRAWTLSCVAILLLVGGVVALQLVASSGYDDARSELRQTAQRQEASAQQVRAALTLSTSASDTIDAVLAVPNTDLITPEDRTTLGAATERAKQDAQAATALIPPPRASPPPAPFWFWELNAAADGLRNESRAAETSATSLDAAAKTLHTSTGDMQSTGSAALLAAADRASGAEAANVPATNDSVLALRGSVAQVKELAVPLQDRLSSAFPALVLAVQNLQTSHAATLAAESGPLEDSRMQLEAFARSLAPGILLDFEWADLVNGKGGPNGYLSGETAWWYDRGGYATIRLSNSIAEDWPNGSARAIVAHEVGHAITIRCRTMYDANDGPTAEAWATAWAISMGFTEDANGTSAYGAPPESMVATAAGCR